MPDRRRRNRRRRTPIAGPTHDAGLTSGGGPAVAEPDPPSMGQVEFLDRAVRCYLRAGNLAEAAECLSQLGDHDQAAVLHLRLGDYPRAAGTYLKAGEPEAAAWVHVHYLGDPERAREILKHLSEPAPLATRPIGVSTRTESVESRLRVLQDRFRAVSASLQGPPPVPAALAGEPGTGSVAPAGLARSRIILVADYLAGASPSSIKPEARLEEIRTLSGRRSVRTTGRPGTPRGNWSACWSESGTCKRKTGRRPNGDTRRAWPRLCPSTWSRLAVTWPTAQACSESAPCWPRRRRCWQNLERRARNGSRTGRSPSPRHCAGMTRSP